MMGDEVRDPNDPRWRLALRRAGGAVARVTSGRHEYAPSRLFDAHAAVLAVLYLTRPTGPTLADALAAEAHTRGGWDAACREAARYYGAPGEDQPITPALVESTRGVAWQFVGEHEEAIKAIAEAFMEGRHLTRAQVREIAEAVTPGGIW
jgi:hypothetical protein